MKFLVLLIIIVILVQDGYPTWQALGLLALAIFLRILFVPVFAMIRS